MVLNLYLKETTKSFIVDGISFDEQNLWIFTNENVKNHMLKLLKNNGLQSIIYETDAQAVVHLQTNTFSLVKTEQVKVYIR